MRGRVEESKVMIICGDKCSDLNEILHRRGRAGDHNTDQPPGCLPTLWGLEMGIFMFMFFMASL